MFGTYSVELSGLWIPESTVSSEVRDVGRLHTFFFNTPLGFEGNNNLFRQADIIRQEFTSQIAGGEFNVRSPMWLRTEIGGTVEFGKDPDPTSTKDRRGVAIYNLRVDAAGTYAISFNTTSATPEGRLRVFVDNQQLGDVVEIPTEGDTDIRTVTLGAGFHSLRLAWVGGFYAVNTVKIRRI